jgi:hypothetical protein
MASQNALEILAGLLQSGKARPDVNPARLAPSAIYDLHYRMIIVASAFEIHARPYLLGQRRIATSRLKLLQFVAMRPSLVSVMRKWSESQGFAQESILAPHQLRRGFLNDEIHDCVVSFLVARGLLGRMESHLVSVESSDFLKNLYSAALQYDLFSASLHALRELADITITNKMLEGW